MKKLIGILILNAILFAVRTNAETYYVSPTGSDSNPGTISQPFASWQKLSSVLHAGDIAYIRGGTYRTPKAIGDGNYPVDWRNVNGTSSAHITVSAYPGESPVLNLDNIVETAFIMGFYMSNCSYIDFKGLRITGLQQNPNAQNVEGWRIDLCNQITFTQCEVDHIQGVGFRITQATPTSSVFTFTNCDSHQNGDPHNGGGGVYGNADGFDANGGTVTYIGCRAWWNSDDGFDTFYNDAQVTYTNCWSFWNGFIPGTFTDPGGQADGMGFKWGSTTSDLRTTHLRTFTNCVAFQNKEWGFDQNVAKCIAWFYNNTSYQNGFNNQTHADGTGGGWATGYNLNPPVAVVLKNNISYDDPTSVSNTSGLSQDHNTWNDLSASNSSFASLDATGVTNPRQSDGSLPNLQFLHLSAGSNLINAGVNITNLLFSGSAPDLGAFEYGGSSPTNQSPIANAGKSQVIVLPISLAILDGSASHDADGIIKSYSWSQISGPSSAIILTPDLVTTNVTTLAQGTYKFELVVTDDKGATGKDTATITVNEPTNTNGGSDQLPASARYVKVNIYGGENPYTNGQWNNWNVESSFSSSVFYYSDGTTSPVNANLSWNWSVLDNGGDYGQGAMAPGIVLRYAGYTRRNRTLTIHGLSSSRKYNLEFLASQNQYSDNITVFQLGQFSDSIFTYNNFMNKAVFTDLIPDDQGQLTITISSPNGYNYLNGFILTENNNDDALKTNKGSAQNRTEIVDNSKPSLTIYPNPVSDKFSLDINNSYTGKMKVSIINQAGAETGSYIFNKDQQITHVDLPAKDLVPGIYFVRIVIGNWSDIRKIVKLKN